MTYSVLFDDDFAEVKGIQVSFYFIVPCLTGILALYQLLKKFIFLLGKKLVAWKRDWLIILRFLIGNNLILFSYVVPAFV